jgi:uncharacterized protein (DUF885 family)
VAVGTLRELERSYFDLRWHLDPVAASQAGLTAHDARLGRFSAAALKPAIAALKSVAGALEETAADALEDEIDRTALLNEIRVTLHRFEKERPQARDPEFWLSHVLNGLFVLLRPGDRGPAERAAALAARLGEIAALLDDARATIDDPPRVFAETALAMLPAGVDLVGEASERCAAESPAAAAALAAAAQDATAALQGFRDDLERWRARGGDAFAIGEDAFNFRLHYEQALRDTAPELWRYGHRLAEEIEAELAALAAPFGAPWPDVVDRLRADHPAPEELVAAYRRAMDEARDFVARRGLAPIPDAPLDVIPTPDFMRPVIPFAAYDSPGPYAQDRRGWFYVTVPDGHAPAAERDAQLRDHCRHELAATALHEGYPGHHLHLVHAQGLATETRRNLWSPVTVEGWALYCEDLMAEQGFYRSPEERLFQRLHLLWRAVRVLLDVGLHTRGMTFDEAVTTLTGRLHVSRVNAQAEVRRYCAWPTYQLCYAVGRRELLKLRDDFHAARGDAFTLRGFHDAVLGYGGLPVSLMRWGLDLGE